MSTFVTDQTVLLPGLLSAQTRERRLLVLCAYARLRWYERYATSDVMASPEVGAGGVIGGPLSELQAEAHAAASALAERLPYGVHDQIQLALSTPILDRLERTLQSERTGAGLAMSADLAQRQRLVAASLVTHGPVVHTHSLRRVTGDRDVDVLIETARQARAAYIVSDSPKLVPLHGVVRHEGLETQTRILRFDDFLGSLNLNVGLEEIDGSVLSYAVALQVAH